MEPTPLTSIALATEIRAAKQLMRTAFIDLCYEFSHAQHLDPHEARLKEGALQIRFFDGNQRLNQLLATLSAHSPIDPSD